MSDIEDTAIHVVARAVSDESKQIAMAKAIARVAGNVVARLVGPEEAWKLHMELGRRQFERMGRSRR